MSKWTTSKPYGNYSAWSMGKLLFFVLYFIIAAIGCGRPDPAIPASAGPIAGYKDTLQAMDLAYSTNHEALLLTRFNSLAELRDVVQIHYLKGKPGSLRSMGSKSEVRLTHRCGGREVTSVLKSGISEGDFMRARDGRFWDRAMVGFQSPYTVMHRNDLVRVEILGRKRYPMFGEGDVAFYNLAEEMVRHIAEDDSRRMSPEDLSEKGYINTFNHSMAQAFMTSIFSERLADFVGDVHERYHMPELITGTFTEDQLADIEDGPVDNYIDMINNEWGQELGKWLSRKYRIDRKTNWTPELLANYLNDIQSYHSWTFQIGFEPFRATDEIVIRFAHKINRVIDDVSTLKKYYD